MAESMTNDELLLPCPFCGYVVDNCEHCSRSSEPFEIVNTCRSNDQDTETRDGKLVSCPKCWTEGPLVDEADEKQAIKAWNTRP